MSKTASTHSSMAHDVASSDVSRHQAIRHIVQHASHYLPTQGPIKVFVHHNTLHAFEEQTFEQGVLSGLSLFGAAPYLTESRYRDELARGRIRYEDLEAVLSEDLGDRADDLVASFGTRMALRMAMLKFPMNALPARELQWLLAESDVLHRFRNEVDAKLGDPLHHLPTTPYSRRHADGYSLESRILTTGSSEFASREYRWVSPVPQGRCGVGVPRFSGRPSPLLGDCQGQRLSTSGRCVHRRGGVVRGDLFEQLRDDDQRPGSGVDR
jgi:hypothetical protein